MITHDIDGEIDISGIDNVTEMGMKLTGKAYGLMIDKLYTRKEDAVVRELGANARDAMKDLSIKLGLPMEAFSIQLPNDITHELIIKDNGTGLSVENVHRYLGNLFESSKEKENTSIGAYGLGSKSPFAVTDQYIIESRFEGQIHHFSFFRAKGGIPKLVHLSSFPTDEPNGITFKVPAPPNRYSTYEKAVAAQLFFFDPRPIVGARGDIWDEYGSIAMEEGNWKMIKSSGLRSYYGTSIANMGGVSYPMDTNRLAEIDTDDDFITNLANKQADPEAFKNGLVQRAKLAHNDIFSLTHASGSDIVFALFFNIGDLEVPPSREMLEYDAQTSYNIIIRIEELVAQLSNKFVADIKAKADPSNPKELQKMLVGMSSIINFDVERNRRASETFCKPIHDLSWVIDVANDLPSIHNGYGKLVDGKSTVSARSPSTMLDNLTIDFPHHLVDKEHLSGVRWECDVTGVIGAKDLKVAESIHNTKTKEGYVVIKKEIHPTLRLDTPGFEIVITYKREWKEWVPCIGVTESIHPTNNRVTADVGGYRGIKSKPVKEESNTDRYGYRIRSTETILIIVDDAEKEKEITKYGTWALRREIGLRKKQTEVESLANNPNDCQKTICFLKASDTNFLEFYLKWNEKLTNKATIWKLSELVIPKPPRKIGDSTLTLRGVKAIKYRQSWAERELDNANYGLGVSGSFTSLKVSDIAEPGFMVFSNGKNETTYLDAELTVPVSVKSLTTLMTLLNFLQSNPEEKKQLKLNCIYRLTPINIKNLDKFKEQGFRVLYDVLKTVGVNNDVGSGQFKRRYKFSMLTHALHESDIYGKEVITKADSKGIIVYRSEFTKFMNHGKLACDKLDKHMNRMNRGIDDAHQKDTKLHLPLAFAYSYRRKYKPLAEIEALRVILDEMHFDNWELPAIVWDGVVKPRSQQTLPYAAKVIKHAAKNFKKVRKEFLEDKYREVLFGGFFGRSSTEFTNALKIAQTKLG